MRRRIRNEYAPLAAQGESGGKVLHFIVPEPKGEIGGADLHVLELAFAQLQRSRLQPLVFITQNEEYAARLRSEAIPCVPGHTCNNYLSLIRMLAVLPRHEYISLIHSHGYDANYLVCLMRLLFPRSWGRIPLVMTSHGWVEDSLYHKIKTWAEFVTHGMASRLMVCNPESLNRLSARRSQLSPVYIPNGIRLPETKCESNSKPRLKERLKLPDTTQLVAAVGRLAPEKRFDLYLAACREIARKLETVHFLLVGAGPEREKLERLVKAHGLTGKVTFTGLVTDMESVYRELSLLLLSSDTEGTPRVVLEAMAQSVPVVATKVGGLKDLVIHGETGLLVDRGNVNALAESAIAVLKDEPTRVAWGRKALNRVHNHFSIWKMQARVESVYEQVLANG